MSLCDLASAPGARSIEVADSALIAERLDRYGRACTHVSVDGLNVNAEQVKRGSAWGCRRYASDSVLIASDA